jgi:hypothetical protein
MHPNATVNYRSCMHAHVLIPGLPQSLPALKQLNRYRRRYGPQILATIEPPISLVGPPLGSTRTRTLSPKERYHELHYDNNYDQ